MLLGDCLVTDTAAVPHIGLTIGGIIADKHALQKHIQTLVLRAADVSDIFSQLLLVPAQVLVVEVQVQDRLLSLPRLKKSACAPNSLKMYLAYSNTN